MALIQADEFAQTTKERRECSRTGLPLLLARNRQQAGQRAKIGFRVLDQLGQALVKGNSADLERWFREAAFPEGQVWAETCRASGGSPEREKCWAESLGQIGPRQQVASARPGRVHRGRAVVFRCLLVREDIRPMLMRVARV